MSTRALWEVMDGADGGAFVEGDEDFGFDSPSWTLCTLPEKWLRALVGASPVLMMTTGP